MRRIIPLFLILFGACETAVDPVLPEEEAHAAVYAFFRPDAPLTVDVFGLTPILETPSFGRINDLSIDIYQNTERLETLFQQGQNPLIYQSAFHPIQGIEYRLEVIIDDQPISARSTIPPAVAVGGVEISRELVTVNNGEIGYPFQITFLDPSSTENYYAIEVFVQNCTADCPEELTGRLNPIFFEDLEVNTSGNTNIEIGGVINEEDGFNFIYFDDKGINGEQVQMNILAVPLHLDFSRDQVVHVVLKSLSSEYYQYLSTSDFQREAEEEGSFAEPVQVFTNIVGGVGVFAGYNYAYTSIKNTD